MIQAIPNYLKSEDRLKTYRNWPNSEVTKTDLASAGFVYTGRDDIVQCPFCKVEGHCWQSGDNPMSDHKAWSPDCYFVRSWTPPEGSCPISTEVLSEDGRLRALHQDQGLFESRVETFRNWPRFLKLRPAVLAAAGFFYTNCGDRTVCFCCGLGLGDWEEGDDPWEQHALWYGECDFLNLKKGGGFIERVKVKAKAVDEASKREIEKVEEASKNRCKICYENEVGVIFMPCGHVVACVVCAPVIKQCAVCRESLEATVRL